MKQALIILFLSLTIITNAQNIVDTTKVWSELRTSSSSLSTIFVKFGGDTTFNSHTYKRVYYTNDPDQINWTQLSFIREEGQKVYRVYGGHYMYDALVYDFSLNEGDQVTVNTEFTLTVDSVDHVEIGSELRKRLFMCHSPEFNFGEIWIEGIGSNAGVLYSGTYGYPDFDNKLLCVKKNDTLLYQNPLYNSCYIISDIEENSLNSKKVMVYPNPASNKLNIEVDNFIKAELLDVNGKLIKTENDKNINLQGCSKGIYFVRVITKSGVYAEKIVKQ